MKNFFSFLHHYGVRRDPMFRGLVWRVGAERQREVMAEIRAGIIPARGIRITTADVPGFPEVDIRAELIDISEPDKINKIYEEIQPALEALRKRSESDIDPDSAITTILRSRQKIELCKVPATVELAGDRLAQGFSVGIFVNFRATIDELCKRLKCDFIDGTVTGAKRDSVISNFQSNESRCLALNSDAAGISIGLQDLDGEHPRFGLVSPPWSATTFKQLVGRFPRDGGKSKSHFRVLFAANTIEMKMYRALKGKLDNLSALCDADLQPDNLRYEPS